MAFNTLSKAALVAALALGAVCSATAADQPKLMMGANAAMLANTCVGCHGDNGSSMGPATPTIAGLSPVYFAETMEGFASGDIPSTIMGRIAKGYTKDEIKTLAKFYEKKPFTKAKQTFDPTLAQKGEKLHQKYCEKCHADGGTSAEDDAGILAGQWTPYLQWTLGDFIAGDREASRKMRKRLSRLKEHKGSEGFKDLLNYYASQQK